MSELKLATFHAAAEADAVALGNPPEGHGAGTTPVRERTWPSYPNEALEQARASDWEVTEGDYHAGESPRAGDPDETEAPDEGTTAFRVGVDGRVFDSGAAISIAYKRNTELLECEENEALDIAGGGLSLVCVGRILPQLKWRAGWQTKVQFRTLANGTFEIEQHLEPEIRGLALSKPVALPHIVLSSLRPTHVFGAHVGLYVVKTGGEPPADVAVFKVFQRGLECVPAELVFLSQLSDVDFLLRPTHLVVDGSGRARGLLIPYHPASSLALTLKRVHPDAEPTILPPFATTESGWALPVKSASIPWLVKLAWLTDIAASVAWLHTQSVFWGDLKTANIVLCRDGHCRLIDYAPGGYTVQWSSPEGAARGAVPAAADIFALGLVLWAVVMEVAEFEREVRDVRPLLAWNEDAPRWLQDLALACLDDRPASRPSAQEVYEALLRGQPL